MGSTLASAGPIAGAAAGGFVQGRQLATEEDRARQQMALQAAEEGRAKETHRLSIQQLGLMISGMQQSQEQASKMFPMQEQMAQFNVRDAGGRPAESEYVKNLPGVPADFGGSRSEAENISNMKLRRDLDANNNAASNDAWERELIRGQMNFIRTDLTEKRKEVAALKKAADALRADDPEHPDLADMDAELQILIGEQQRLEADYRQFMSDLGQDSGFKTPVPGKGKLAPPPMSK